MRDAHPFLLFIGIACLATAVAGDVLVTRSGETVETQGPWKVKGRQVIFTNAQGVLSSLRLADIDLEASEEATKQAAEPATPAAEEPQAPTEEEPRKSILSLTNANIGQADPAAGGIATATGSSGARGIRVTLGTIANGYTVQARLNGRSIPPFSGGQSQAVQLFHVDHPNRARLATDQESDFSNLFCLQEGENEIEIEYQPVEPASLLSLRFYMNSATYSSAIFEFEQEERRPGSLAATFEVYAQMPADHRTQILLP